MILVLAFIGGAVLGSFANVVILRWHASATILGRSACPACKRVLRPQHLVPIFSWLWLRGRCADCGKKIHVQYPLVEFTCAVFAAIAALRFSPLGPQAIDFWFESLLSIALVVPVVMDIRWKELPIEYLAGMALLGYVYQIVRAMIGLEPFGDEGLFIAAVIPFFAAAIPLAFFGLQYLFSRGRWVGLGDIWFGAMMGFVLGTPLLSGFALYCAYLLGGCVAALGLITGWLRRGDRIPFAPALAAGTLIALWYGDRISALF